MGKEQARSTSRLTLAGSTSPGSARHSPAVIIKGVLCAEDADLAVQNGADVVYVSNHGGRHLDYAPAPIEVLAEVVEAV